MRLVSDAAWAIMTIWQEARGEAYVGKLAVARVIRNRMRKRYTSDGTVPGTVLRAYQFSGWNTGDINRLLAAFADDDDPTVRECQRAWTDSAYPEMDAGVGESVLYYAPNALLVPPTWASKAKEVARVGRHVFFTG